MKKIIALSTAIILTLCCFTGCEKSKEDLDETAQTLYKAANSALFEMDEEGLGLGGGAGFSFSSDGSYTGTPGTFEENSQTFIQYLSRWYSDYEDFEWILYIKNGLIEEAYCAETFDSKVVGSHAYDAGNEIELDVEGKTLEDVKVDLRKKGTFEISAEEFVETFNKQVPLVFSSTDSSNWILEKGDVEEGEYAISYSYSYFDDIYNVILTEVDGYLISVWVTLDINLTADYADITDEYKNLFLAFMLAPSIVLDNVAEESELSSLRMELSSALVENSGKLEKDSVSYNLICSDYLGSTLMITPTDR